MLSKQVYHEVPVYFHTYLDKVDSEDFLSGLEDSKRKSLELFANISSSKEDYVYTVGKWSIKQVIQHILDTERVFAYRALRFSRQDTCVLQGFDENLFVNNLKTPLKMPDLVEEYQVVRQSTILLFKKMDAAALDFKGFVGDNKITARQLAFLCVGHNLHHINVIRERYL